MKKSLLLILGATLALSTLVAQSEPLPVRLLWDANPPEDTVTFYTVYEQTAPGIWATLGTVPATSTPSFSLYLDGFPHAYAVSASNGFFESGKSATLNAPISPAAPTGLRINRIP
jgi:hypothetical protein